MARIKPKKGHFNTSRVQQVLLARGMKPEHVAAKTRALHRKSQVKRGRNNVKVTAQRKRDAIAQSKDISTRRLATIAKIGYVSGIAHRAVVGPAGRLASVGRSFRRS